MDRCMTCFNLSPYCTCFQSRRHEQMVEEYVYSDTIWKVVDVVDNPYPDYPEDAHPVLRLVSGSD
jgi:hypothetical protein